MRISSKGNGPVTRLRIGSLRLRISAGDVHSAKALATAIASKLALRAGDLSGAAGQELLQTRVVAPPSISQESLADSIVEKIANGSRRSGGQ
jgi:hypothetical protein